MKITFTQGLIHRTKGRILFVLGNQHKALENYQKSLQIHLALENNYYIALSYGDIGNLFYRERNYEEALKYFLQSEHYFKDEFHKKENTYGKLIMAISLTYYHLKQNDKAKVYCEKASMNFSISGNNKELDKCLKWMHILIQIED
jgi:tetratricopeptide (TPR) repeat protein